MEGGKGRKEGRWGERKKKDRGREREDRNKKVGRNRNSG